MMGHFPPPFTNKLPWEILPPPHIGNPCSLPTLSFIHISLAVSQMFPFTLATLAVLSETLLLPPFTFTRATLVCIFEAFVVLFLYLIPPCPPHTGNPGLVPLSSPSHSPCWNPGWSPPHPCMQNPGRVMSPLVLVSIYTAQLLH